MGRWWEWDGDGGGLPKTGGVGGSHPITPYPAALPHSPAASWRCRGVRGSRRSRGGRRGQGDPVGGRLGGVCVCQWDKGGGTNATMEVFRGTPPPKPILTLSPGSPGAPGGPCVPGGPDMPWGGGGETDQRHGVMVALGVGGGHNKVLPPHPIASPNGGGGCLTAGPSGPGGPSTNMPCGRRRGGV